MAKNPIVTIETDIETAKKDGAMALFGEKYGSVVRMVKMGDFSTELCGGTHLDNTAKAGLFKIISESSVAAGIRRIEGTTGQGVLTLLSEKDALIEATAKEMKVAATDITKRAAQLQSEIKAAKSEIESLEAKMASSKIDVLRKSAKDVNGTTVYSGRLDGLALPAVRNLCDELRAENENSVTVVASVVDGKLNFICGCGKDAVAQGANAGRIVKEVAAICGGSGGGRPDTATAGGKDIDKIPSAIDSVEAIVKNYIK